MLKFLFGGRSKISKVTQRESVEALLADLNSILVQMSDKPKVVIDPNTGVIDLELPEQMPDEALALPAPEDKKEDTAA